MRAAFFIVGAAVEVVGIVAVSAPDFVPGLRRLSRWILLRWRPLENRFRRWLGLPLRTTRVFAEAALSLESAMGVSPAAKVEQGATLERKVEFLLTRDQEAQHAENDLGVRVSAIDAHVPERLEGVRPP